CRASVVRANRRLGGERLPRPFGEYGRRRPQPLDADHTNLGDHASRQCG
ncbi:putative gp5 C-terminal domain protein, partial [Vibrio parahaemolyticus SBR10290]